MTAIANLPNLRPSLLLDFANSGRVDPRIQCTRASSATCFGPDGKLRTVAANVPRIDYDHVTGKCLGLLVESQRSNLLINSLALSGYTQGPNGTYSAGRIGIDGVTPSVRVVANALGNVYLSKSTTVVAGAYTASIYFCADAKPTRGGLLRVEEIQADGSKIVKVFYFADASVVADGKWRRYELTVTHAAAGTSSVFFAADPGVGESIDLCAAQYEAGSKASSYISTAASAVTRAADAGSIPLGKWFNPEEGALIVEGQTRILQAGVNANALSITDGTASNRMDFRLSKNNTNTDIIINSGGAESLFSSINDASTSVRRFGLGYKKDDFVAVREGVVSTVSNAGNVPTGLDRMVLGNFPNTASSENLNGYLQKVIYYPRRLTNAQLQRLTA